MNPASAAHYAFSRGPQTGPCQVSSSVTVNWKGATPQLRTQNTDFCVRDTKRKSIKLHVSGTKKARFFFSLLSQNKKPLL